MDYLNLSEPDLDSIDESSLSFHERLGLAYCRLNCWQWDDLIGTKPEGFDELPDYCGQGSDRQNLYKKDFITPALEVISAILGEAQCNRYWWRFKLGRSDAEWVQWYIQKRIRASQTRNKAKAKAGWIAWLQGLKRRQQ